MTYQPVVHNTFVIDRSFMKPVDTVYSAFANPAKKRRWYADRDHESVDVFEMDFRIGGHEVLQYRLKEDSPFPGAVIHNHADFLNIIPERRIVCSSTMAFGETPFSVSLVTFEFVPTANGTDLVFTHQGAFFEHADGPELRQLGWRTLLDRAAKEIAAEADDVHAGIRFDD